MKYKADIEVEIDCNKLTCGKCKHRKDKFFIHGNRKGTWNGLLCKIFKIELEISFSLSIPLRCKPCLDKFEPVKE